MKKILITGANSYIGDSVKEYLLKWQDDYIVDVKDTIGWEPVLSDFSGYDVVFNVAGIAHIKETKKNRHLYYEINRDLVVKIAKTAKEAGVGQFILLSTMSVYGMTTGYITKQTKVNPKSAYGKSKAEADEIIKNISDDSFKFVCLRPPMVYGKGCKGNYQRLRKVALRSPVFPKYANERSMIYIDNLSEFIKLCIDRKNSGVFFPQNSEYVNTSELVQLIAEENKKKIKLVKHLDWLIKIIPGSMKKKIFGDLIYESVDRINCVSFRNSIVFTENIK